MVVGGHASSIDDARSASPVQLRVLGPVRIQARDLRALHVPSTLAALLGYLALHTHRRATGRPGRLNLPFLALGGTFCES